MTNVFFLLKQFLIIKQWVRNRDTTGEQLISAKIVSRDYRINFFAGLLKNSFNLKRKSALSFL